MELQQILSKMEADGWEISKDFKIAHGHFLQYFLETVEEALRQPPVSGSVCAHKNKKESEFMSTHWYCSDCNMMLNKQTVR